MPRKRRHSLGSTALEHAALASNGLERAYQQLNAVDEAARRKDCAGIWDGLVAAQANLAYAHAHLESDSRAPQHLEDRHYRYLGRALRLRETLGFQCTRRRGGIR